MPLHNVSQPVLFVLALIYLSAGNPSTLSFLISHTDRFIGDSSPIRRNSPSRNITKGCHPAITFLGSEETVLLLYCHQGKHECVQIVITTVPICLISISITVLRIGFYTISAELFIQNGVRIAELNQSVLESQYSTLYHERLGGAFEFLVLWIRKVSGLLVRIPIGYQFVEL